MSCFKKGQDNLLQNWNSQEYPFSIKPSRSITLDTNGKIFLWLSWVLKRQRNLRSNYQHLLDHKESKGVPEKHLFLLHWLCQRLTLWTTTNCGKYLEMGISDHLTCLLRNLYAGQQTTVRTGHGTTDWFQIRQGVRQACVLSPCLLNLYAEYIMQNAEPDEAQAGNKITGRNYR